MNVTAIKAQVKTKNRVSVFVDGKYSFSLSLDQLLEQKLKKGDELSDTDVKQLKKLSDEGKLKQRALEWLLNRPHSKREFRDYMYRKKAEKDLTEAWEEEFEQKGYLSDLNFTRWFMENRLRKNKSSRAIESELRSKGISPVTIQSVVTELEADNNDKDALKSLINKLRYRPRYSDEVKLKQHLMQKGFKYSEIKEALEEVKREL